MNYIRHSISDPSDFGLTTSIPTFHFRHPFTTMQPTTAKLIILLIGSSSSSRYLNTVLALPFYSTNVYSGINTPRPYSGSKIGNVFCATASQSSSSLSSLSSPRHVILATSRRRRKFSPILTGATSSSENLSRYRGGDTSRSRPYIAIVTEPDSCDDDI